MTPADAARESLLPAAPPQPAAAPRLVGPERPGADQATPDRPGATAPGAIPNGPDAAAAAAAGPDSAPAPAAAGPDSSGAADALAKAPKLPPWRAIPKPVALGALSLAVTLLAWLLLARLVGPRRLPAPGAVLAEIIRLAQTPLSGRPLLGHVLFSLRRVLAAYGLAVATGLPLGLMMGWNAAIRKIAMPIFEIFRPIPPIAWIPIAILWLGVGEGSKIYICYVGAFIILCLNAFTGIRYVDPLLISAARTLGAGRRSLFLGVAVPAALPSIFAGLQNAMSMAWMCVLAAELVGGREGIGFIIIQGMNLDRPDMIMAGMVVIGAMGAVIAFGLRILEKLVCPWRRELV